jgi:hypothetical protein
VRLLTFFTLLCCSLLASAATVKNLYNVKVPVEDQTEEARIDAIGGAFQRVLVRMAGTRVVLDNTLLVNEQPNAQNYMSSLRYERSEEGGLLLSVTFMPDQLQALLERASAPLWGESRPRLLLLLAVNTSDGRITIGPEEPEDPEEWKETFATAMHDRGLPWMFPSWDLEDQMALPIASLWGLFEDDIDSAAERYSSDGYLAGRIMATPGAYSFTGYLNQGDIYHAMSLQAESPDSLSTELAGAVAEKLSERYAVIPLTGIDNSELIRISGVSSFADYHAVIEYLDAHVAVRDVVVVSSDRDQLTLALDLTTSWQQVFDSMVLDNRILFNEEGGDYAWQR